MDDELHDMASTLKESFERRSGDDAVDEELTFLKNLLESLASQNGAPGPASHLLTMLGVNPPHIDLPRHDKKS